MKLLRLLAVLLVGIALAPLDALALTPADVGLHEGDMISSFKADGNPDIFIINQYGYKRLFLNEVIFTFYGHLHYEDVRQLTAFGRDSFVTSLLFKNCEAGDPRTYALEVTGGDTGTLHPLAMSEQQLATEDPEYTKKTFCINNAEFSWYTSGGRSLGISYVRLAEIPGYRQGFTAATPVPTSPEVTPTTVLYMKWAPAVAELVCFNADGDAQGGSGTLLRMLNGKYVVLTNYHVVAQTEACVALFREDVSGRSSLESTVRIYAAFVTGSLTDADDDEVYLTLVALDEDTRDKLIEAIAGTSARNYPEDLSSIPDIARRELCSSDASIGDRVAVIGYPSIGASVTPTLTDGVISGRDENYYITSAKIDAGNSGGAAVLVSRDCYLGIPTGTTVGAYESLGRILDITRFPVFGRSVQQFLPASFLKIIEHFWK